MVIDNRPPYARIATHYREKIHSGEMATGTLLPSLKVLSREWKVSAATAEKAISSLRAEGLVRGIPGVGTEVIGRPRRLSSGSQRAIWGSHTESAWRGSERYDSHRAEIVPAPKDVADALGIGQGDRVIQQSRVYRDRHRIVAHSTSWIPAELGKAAPELLRSSRLMSDTPLDVIARTTGRAVSTQIHEVAARIATAEDAELLDMEPDTVAAIVVMTCLFLDSSGRPLRYEVDLGAPGRVWAAESDATV